MLQCDKYSVTPLWGRIGEKALLLLIAITPFFCRHLLILSDEGMERVHIASRSQGRCKEETSEKWVFGELKKKVTSGLVKSFSELNITPSTEYFV